MSSGICFDTFGNRLWVNKQGERHRIYGPAVEFANGKKEWWVEDKSITKLVRKLLAKSPFGEDVHLGILAEYFAERDDFRLLEVVQPFLTEEL